MIGQLLVTGNTTSMCPMVTAITTVQLAASQRASAGRPGSPAREAAAGTGTAGSATGGEPVDDLPDISDHEKREYERQRGVARRRAWLMPGVAMAGPRPDGQEPTCKSMKTIEAARRRRDRLAARM